MKSAASFLALGLLNASVAFGSLFSENWTKAAGDKFPDWVVVHGAGEAQAVSTTAGPVMRAAPKDQFMMRTDRTIQVGEAFAVRARMALPPDESRAGAGVGLRSEELGPESGYRAMINPRNREVLLFRMNGDGKETRLAWTKMPIPAGSFTCELQVRRQESGGAKLAVKIDSQVALEHEDNAPWPLGSHVRVVLSSRSGKTFDVGPVEVVEL